MSNVFIQPPLDRLVCDSLSLSSIELKNVFDKSTYRVIVYAPLFVEDNSKNEQFESSSEKKKFVESALKNPLMHFEVTNTLGSFVFYKLFLDSIFTPYEEHPEVKYYSFAQSSGGLSILMNLPAITYKKSWWVFDIKNVS